MRPRIYGVVLRIESLRRQCLQKGSTMKLVMKFMGVSPDQLAKLHAVIKSPAIAGTNTIARPVDGVDGTIWFEDRSPKHAEILKSHFDKENGEYIVEVGVNVNMPTVGQRLVRSRDAYKSDKMESCRGDNDLFVDRQVIHHIFDSLDIFPEKEELRPVINTRA